MTMLSPSINDGITGWRRLLKWLKAFEEALDYDPAGRAVDDLNRKVSELEEAVRVLNAGSVNEPSAADIEAYLNSGVG